MPGFVNEVWSQRKPTFSRQTAKMIGTNELSPDEGVKALRTMFVYRQGSADKPQPILEAPLQLLETLDGWDVIKGPSGAEGETPRVLVVPFLYERFLSYLRNQGVGVAVPPFVSWVEGKFSVENLRFEDGLILVDRRFFTWLLTVWGKSSQRPWFEHEAWHLNREMNPDVDVEGIERESQDAVPIRDMMTAYSLRSAGDAEAPKVWAAGAESLRESLSSVSVASLESVTIEKLAVSHFIAFPDAEPQEHLQFVQRLSAAGFREGTNLATAALLDVNGTLARLGHEIGLKELVSLEELIPWGLPFRDPLAAFEWAAEAHRNRLAIQGLWNREPPALLRSSSQVGFDGAGFIANRNGAEWFDAESLVETRPPWPFWFDALSAMPEFPPRAQIVEFVPETNDLLLARYGWDSSRALDGVVSSVAVPASILAEPRYVAIPALSVLSTFGRALSYEGGGSDLVRNATAIVHAALSYSAWKFDGATVANFKFNTGSSLEEVPSDLRPGLVAWLRRQELLVPGFAQALADLLSKVELSTGALKTRPDPQGPWVYNTMGYQTLKRSDGQPYLGVAVSRDERRRLSEAAWKAVLALPEFFNALAISLGDAQLAGSLQRLLDPTGSPLLPEYYGALRRGDLPRADEVMILRRILPLSGENWLAHQQTILSTALPLYRVLGADRFGLLLSSFVSDFEPKQTKRLVELIGEFSSEAAESRFSEARVVWSTDEPKLRDRIEYAVALFGEGVVRELMSTLRPVAMRDLLASLDVVRNEDFAFKRDGATGAERRARALLEWDRRVQAVRTDVDRGSRDTPEIRLFEATYPKALRIVARSLAEELSVPVGVPALRNFLSEADAIRILGYAGSRKAEKAEEPLIPKRPTEEQLKFEIRMKRFTQEATAVAREILADPSTANAALWTDELSGGALALKYLLSAKDRAGVEVYLRTLPFVIGSGPVLSETNLLPFSDRAALWDELFKLTVPTSATEESSWWKGMDRSLRRTRQEVADFRSWVKAHRGPSLPTRRVIGAAYRSLSQLLMLLSEEVWTSNVVVASRILEELDFLVLLGNNPDFFARAYRLFPDRVVTLFLHSGPLAAARTINVLEMKNRALSGHLLTQIRTRDPDAYKTLELWRRWYAGVVGGSTVRTREVISQTIRNKYAVLGCRKDATYDELRKAYRALVMVLHPDKVRTDDPQESEYWYNEVTAAWESLKEPEKRRQIDRLLPDRDRSFPTVNLFKDVDLADEGS